MSQQNINIGTGPSAGNGDPLRTAFSKINQNFAELYSNVGSLTNSVTSVAGRTGNVILTTQDIVGFNTNNFATVSYVQSVIGNASGNISSLSNDGYTFSIDEVGDIIAPNNTVFLTAGGDITFTPADDLRLNGGSPAADLQQEGGDIIINGGTGSDANATATISAGDGGDVVINGGTAGGTAGNNALGSLGGDISINGGYTTLDGADGGDISIAAGGSVSDNSGNISLRTGNSSGVYNWAFTNTGTLTFPDATVQTTAYQGNLLSTIAKTGGPAPGTGEVATVALNPTNNTNFVPGTYPGVFLALNAGFSITLDVAANGDLTATVINSNAGFSVGEQAILNGAAIAGGTTGVDDVAVNIATITNISVPTALDLTKQVQKLTDGWYTLADGQEGQVMHLVRQDAATLDQVTLTVTSGRVNGTVYTDILYSPFIFNSLPNDLITLIFTDGAWQSSNGAWD